MNIYALKENGDITSYTFTYLALIKLVLTGNGKNGANFWKFQISVLETVQTLTYCNHPSTKLDSVSCQAYINYKGSRLAVLYRPTETTLSDRTSRRLELAEFSPVRAPDDFLSEPFR
ncbi:hypothetical protein WA026_010759 [Henosepilachna vigintioctopunctata]|uniref:Uncharacterized protein n=1 Tax=Henosepilachna vigintioctopunctata TaxID=420089 RepID=A0AAW1UWN9_9CUCU